MSENKIFVLIGSEDNELLNCSKDILGIYRDFRDALYDIRKYEQEEDNYQCFECDYGFDNKEKFTKLQIENKICPECGGVIQYFPEIYEDFRIEEFSILKKPYYKYGFDNGKIIYESSLLDNGNVRQNFSTIELNKKYKEFRKVNEPIFIED